ncbi:hypothetical protein EXIGLDRAFT_780199 [Exidia glandulosa HHB12029]|uniref:F-box domain-containing protein n=1 Tax=Exidia glandulosa HHB12029 TaxID=1314781 RepID=A0A165BQI8_EXIGL|nr:hypothetical protein EXIGLDRAFT_780199 [Exidia glandulosa HHB12029]
MALQPLTHLPNPHYSMFHECSGTIISTMHIDQRHPLNIDVIQLFHTLAAMPSLVDLAIRLDNIPHLTRRTKTPPMPFRLRRLELNCVFRGWPRLLAQSGKTLTDLTLGGPGVVQDQTFLSTNEYEKIRSVTTLRLDNLFDNAFLYACAKLRSLELNTRTIVIGRMLGDIAAPPRPLQNLVLGFQPSQSGHGLWDVIDFLHLFIPAIAALRCLTIKSSTDQLPRFEDVLNDRGRTARAILEGVCRRRRVALSIH